MLFTVCEMINSLKIHLTHLSYMFTCLWLIFQEQLSDKYGVTGIPSLIFLDPKTGDLVSDDGRSLVENDPDGDKFPWK